MKTLFAIAFICLFSLIECQSFVPSEAQLMCITEEITRIATEEDPTVSVTAVCFSNRRRKPQAMPSLFIINLLSLLLMQAAETCQNTDCINVVAPIYSSCDFDIVAGECKS